MTSQTTTYTTLLQRAEAAHGRKEAIKLINAATRIREQHKALLQPHLST